MKRNVILFLFCLLGLTASAAGRKEKAADRALADKVARWQIEHFAQVKHHNLDWTNGALYRGMAEWAAYTGREEYFDFLRDVGERNGWGFLPRVYHADDLCVGQMYLAMYRRYGDPAMIDATVRRLNHLVLFPSTVPLWHGVKGGSDRWSWCDALFMAPPVFVEGYLVTGDEKYLQFLDREFRLTTDSLFCYERGLYWRDRNFKPRSERNGQPVFWGRGNGWVAGGLALLLEYLPRDHYTYGYYEDIFKRLCAAAVKCQDAEGSWHASMLDPASYPPAENSSSGFFTFALAWGVNHGVLEGPEYRDAAAKGWRALKSYVDSDGKLGNVQPIGAAPGAVDRDMTEVYGVGAFLLAAKEMIEMKR